MENGEPKFLGDQKYLLDEKKGAFAKYRTLFIGKSSLFYLLKFELVTTLFSAVPGGLGLLLRKLFFRRLFKKCGRGVVFGKNMTLRHARKVSIGDGVVFDDNTVVDAKGEDNQGIHIGDRVLVGRNTILSCKGGDLTIGDYSNIGPNNTLISESRLNIGKYVFTAGHCYLIAGGNHSHERKDIPIWFQPSVSRGGIRIEDDIWIGASVTILDGVHIGSGSIIGAGSLVNKHIPGGAIAFGVPAEVKKKR